MEVNRTDPLTGATATTLNVGPSTSTKKLTTEEKARRRVQMRLSRRYNASEKDHVAKEQRIIDEQRQAEEDYVKNVEQQDVEKATTFATMKLQREPYGLPDRNTHSMNDSQRDHISHRKKHSKRHRDEKQEAQEETFIERRGGPGDRSVSRLDKERPVESSLFRHGLMLVGEQDTANMPKLQLAYDAHDYEEEEPVNIRVANEHRQQSRMMPLDADGSYLAGESPMRPDVFKRPMSRETRRNLLGSARGDPSRDPSATVLTETYEYEGSPIGKVAPSTIFKPEFGPGAFPSGVGKSPGGEDDEKEDDGGSPGVEVAPMQKYPMWTT